MNDLKTDVGPRAVPWGLRDVWLGIVCLVAWMLIAFGAAVVLRRMHWPGLATPLLAALELVLFLPVWWLAVRQYGARWRDLGLSGFRLRHLGLGVVLFVPVLGISAVYQTWLAQQGLEMQPGLEQVLSGGPFPVLLAVTVVVLAPLAEEVFFRGFLFAGIAKRLSWPVGAVLSAFLFALLHVQPLAVPPLFLLGLLFAVLYQRSGSIWPAIILHATLNALALIGVYLA
ncbi:MAG: CPBP family intramembrane glutamic endopeptidase [Thermodesulfobacteriota bacterium]